LLKVDCGQHKAPAAIQLAKPTTTARDMPVSYLKLYDMFYQPSRRALGQIGHHYILLNFARFPEFKYMGFRATWKALTWLGASPSCEPLLPLLIHSAMELYACQPGSFQICCCCCSSCIFYSPITCSQRHLAVV
jgi:hypothetical protein